MRVIELILLSCWVLLVVGCTSPKMDEASAQPVVVEEVVPICLATREQMVVGLFNVFGETLRSVGLTDGEKILELYTNSETGTWTVLQTEPNGCTTPLHSGQFWQDIPPPASTEGLPS